MCIKVMKLEGTISTSFLIESLVKTLSPKIILLGFFHLSFKCRDFVILFDILKNALSINAMLQTFFMVK